MIVNKYRNKELSWLYFNERVLQEAGRTEVPLIERLKFLGIYSNNLDEYFRVRVATLRRLAKDGRNPKIDGGYPSEILTRIHEIVIKQRDTFNKIYDNLMIELKKNNIIVVSETQLNDEQGAYIKKFFINKVRPKLIPLIISKDRELPDLKDATIYLAIELTNSKENSKEYALLELPTDIDRFVKLPGSDNKHYIILLDDVIRYSLNDVFYMLDFDDIKAYTIKLTRDAEMDLDDEISPSYVERISSALEKRKDALPVRFTCDENIPEDFFRILFKKLNFSKEDVIIRGGRYHNHKDFIDFPNLGSGDLEYPELPPAVHKDLVSGKTFISTIRKKDLLFHFPYHSFLNFINFLQEASIDPKVTHIKITIYRLAKSSGVIKSLISAARNGKKVTAVFELQARFDEKANINWADMLRNEGVEVIYGVPGLKVHSKLCLVVRKEGRKLVNYACIGTGNFNEDSAKIFSDVLLLTSHTEITNEVSAVFEFINRNYKISRYKHLLISPLNLRDRFSQLLNREIKNSRAGKPAYAYIKVNNLADPSVIRKLYRAKKLGVDIRLNVRGMLSLIPRFDKSSDEIPSIAIIDRFLEHSRVFIFCNNNNPEVFISSADLMQRNLDRRIEVICPIYDDSLKKELIDLFDLQWKDNYSARILDNNLKNKMRKNNSDKIIRSQVEWYNYFKSKD